MSRSTQPRAPLLLVVLLGLLGSWSTSLAAPAWKDGEIVIKFKENARTSDIARIRGALHAQRLKHFARLKADHEKISGLTVEQAVARFKNDPAVQYIEPNYVVHTSAVPNDPLFDQLWGMQKISAPLAWDVTTGTDILVGMIDTGVDYTHPDLAANIYTNPGEIPDNGIDDDQNGYVDDVRGWDFVNQDNDPMDDNEHGTHTAGTVAAVGNNGIGVAGVCWHARILPLKFLNSAGFGFTVDAASAVEYATMMHARLTSNSWGGGAFSQLLFDAIAEANDAGILFVAAAGNAANDNDQFPAYPATYDLPNIISVAATNSSDALAGFSSFGANTVHLAAPGVAVLSTTPENTYSTFSGTSMATPHVAGALALVLSKYPELSAAHAKELILESVDPLPNLRGVVRTGGRLNVARALEGPDDVPPAAIQDLAVLSSTSNRIRLSWTATGNDGTVGAALAYDLRYAPTPITEAAFASATRFPHMPGPALAGTHQDVTLTGLDPSTTYWFALKALDGFGNASPISNLASGATLPAPDIHVSPVSLAVSLGQNGTDSRTISITNPSAGILDFEIGYAATGAPEPAPAAATATALSIPRPRSWGGYVRQAPSLQTASGRALISTASLPVVVSDPSGDGGAVDMTELRAAPDQTNLSFELRFAAPIDRLHFGGFLFLDIDQNRFTGVPPVFASPGQDIGAEFEIQLFSLAAGTVQLFHAASHTLLANIPVTVESQALRFSVPLFLLGDDDGSMDVTGVVGSEAAATDYLPDTGHGSIRGVRWVRVTPESGSIPPGGSLDLAVAFDGRGLRDGAYDGEIRIRSNDPDQPEVPVTAHADVTGAPRIDVSLLEFDFGLVTVGGSRTDSLVISNLGTGLLDVFAVTSDQAAFSVGFAPFTLPPSGRRVVPITFTPPAVGPFSGNLQVSSDDPEGGELFGFFAGSGVPPPHMLASTQEIHAGLRTGETSTQPFVISNTGSGDLVLELSVQASPASVSSAAASGPQSASAPPPRNPTAAGAEQSDATPVESGILGGPSAQIPVLVIQNTKAWGLEVGPMIHARFGIPVRVIHSGQVREADFARFDLIVTVTDEAAPYYDTLSTYVAKFDDYVRNGGTVFYQVGTFTGVRLAGGAQYVFGNYEDRNRVDLPGHPIMAGLPWLPEEGNLNFGTIANLPAGADVITETYLTHLPTIVEYTLGKGRVIATGTTPEYDFLFPTSSAPVLPQTVAYCLNRTPPRWIRVDPLSAVVPPGGALLAQVRFDAAWASGGPHEAMLRIDTNDLSQRSLLVPVSLEVTPLPDIRISRASLDLGGVFVGASRSDSLFVSNEGAAPLNVTGLSVDNGAFTPGPGPFSVAPGESAAVQVTFHPASLGPQTGTLRIRSDDPDEPEVQVSLSGTGTPPPIVSVTPAALQFRLTPGGRETRAVAVGNQGGSELSFASEFQAPPGSSAPEAAPPDGPKLPKGVVDTRAGVAVIRHIGAPDRFGHTWIDSDEPGGPAFEWVEISGIGKKIPFLGDDIISSRIPIGFSFPFFGGSFDSLRISSNGYISFTSRASDYSNLPLPSPLAPENLIAPYWDDLFAAYFSNTYVHSDGQRMVVEFQDYIPFFADIDDKVTFEIILDRSGEFRMQYLWMPGQTDIGTVGFQNAARDDGSLIAFNTPYVHDQLAIRVTSRPAWVALDPGAGAISPGGAMDLLTSIDASGLGTGRYDTILLLHSNDPVTPVVRVPIALRVLTAVAATATKISPATLQTRSGGKQVQAFVELPTGLDPARVVLSSVRFQGTVPATQMRLGDFNGNGTSDLSFQFDRASAVAALPAGDPVDVAITGEVQDVALFTGHASVHVVRPRAVAAGEAEESDLPRVAALHQNRPNPFNPSTSIGLDLPQESAARLTIHAADGRVVRTLIEGRVAAGRKQIVWDGRDDQGRPVASGVYFCKLSAGAFQASRRLVLLK